MKHDSLLITGGAGFVGSNLALLFKRKYPPMAVTVMDNLKRRGSELNVPRLRAAGIDFVHGDIRCLEDFPRHEYSALIECSAEPSVLAGYDGNPFYVINTNLNGTINCLEEARKHKADVIFISTSRVYPYDRINGIGTQEEETRFVWKDDQNVPGWSRNGIAEGFLLEGPRSIYGASKLCSEYIMQEYISMYGLRGVINRCGVIAGPWQFGKVDQGVFTLWMLAHYFKKSDLKYIGFGGNGKQVRDLMHIDDLFDLIHLQLTNLEQVNGKIFNAGGGHDISLSLMETTDLCRDISGNTITISREEKTRPADLAIYLTDSSTLLNTMRWKPTRSSRKIMEDIFAWIHANEQVLKNL